jgi:hypothetical protein
MPCTVAHDSKDTRTLCFDCYRFERDRRHASTLGDAPAAAVRSPFAPALTALTERQVAHRQAMIDFARSRCR